ncbi:MAG: hypothetical protein WCG75_13045 [Armatimonadota bacterium]
MKTRADRQTDPILLGVLMLAMAFLGLLGGSTLAGLFLALGSCFVAFCLGLSLFRRTWPRECWNATRAWSGVWLVACGLVGIFLTLMTSYVNLGPEYRKGYEIAVTKLYGQQIFWFFGGIIFLILGIVLIARCLALHPPRR